MKLNFKTEIPLEKHSRQVFRRQFFDKKKFVKI